MISLKTWAALCVRATSSSRSDATAIGAAKKQIVEKSRRYLGIYFSLSLYGRLYLRHCTLILRERSNKWSNALIVADQLESDADRSMLSANTNAMLSKSDQPRCGISGQQCSSSFPGYSQKWFIVHRLVNPPVQNWRRTQPGGQRQGAPLHAMRTTMFAEIRGWS
jgi:hypothetical protein